MVVPQNKKIDGFCPVLTPISELENLHLTLVNRLDNREDKEQVKDLVKNLDDFKEVIDKVKSNSKPEYCGSCHTKQTDITTKYCQSCQKDPWYNASTNKAIGFMMGGEKMKFGCFEADYAEFQEFKSFMKFKTLSSKDKKEC